MTQLLDFIKSLDTMQVLLVGAALLLLWPQITKLYKASKEKLITPHPAPTSHELTQLICKWECLADECHELGLHDACKKLKEVFPMLIKTYEFHRNEK